MPIAIRGANLADYRDSPTNIPSLFLSLAIQKASVVSRGTIKFTSSSIPEFHYLLSILVEQQSVDSIENTNVEDKSNSAFENAAANFAFAEQLNAASALSRFALPPESDPPTIHVLYTDMIYGAFNGYQANGTVSASAARVCEPVCARVHVYEKHASLGGHATLRRVFYFSPLC